MTICAWGDHPATGTALTADHRPKRVPACDKHGKRGSYQPSVKRVEPKTGALEWTSRSIKNAKDTSYEVWEIDLLTGTVVTMRVGRYTYPTAERAAWKAAEYIAEEAANARMEMRPVKSEFIVIKSTTTYKRVQS